MIDPEQAARARKAYALAEALVAAGTTDPELARHLDEEGWLALAELAGQRPPSEKTRELVLELLEERQKLQAADPFACFDQERRRLERAGVDERTRAANVARTGGAGQ